MTASAMPPASDTNTTNTEEPGGQRRARRATIRYDRLAASISLANALIWALLLVRNWIVPAAPESLLPVEKTLRGVASTLPTGLVPVGLIAFVIVDCALAWLLFRGVKYGRLLMFTHAAIAIGACLIYFVSLKDFGPAFFLGTLQGVILVLLSKKASNLASSEVNIE